MRPKEKRVEQMVTFNNVEMRWLLASHKEIRSTTASARRPSTSMASAGSTIPPLNSEQARSQFLITADHPKKVQCAIQKN